MSMRPAKVFISYAHEDELLKDELLKHLLVLQREGLIEPYDDSMIVAGNEWDREIRDELDQADVILLLISSDFLASEYCWAIEMTRALEMHDRKSACVIPIVLRPAPWQNMPFAHLQALPRRAKPVVEWSSPDAAFVDVVDGIRTALEDRLPVKPKPNSLELLKPVAEFTGRQVELESLGREVAGGKSRVIVHGMAGVGKSQLARSLAISLTVRFPEAAMMLDLQGATSRKALSPSDAMRAILQALDPRCRLPDAAEPLAAEYRGRMRKLRGILLLDNASDPEQVEPLLPPDSWLLLVTSRRNFMLPGAVSHELRTMAPGEARQMLASILPASRPTSQADLDQVLQACGFLPMAIEIAGRALVERPDWTCGAYARRLNDDRSTALSEVMAAIGSSHELLEHGVGEKFLELSVFSTAFELRSAAAVWDVAEDEADKVLGELLKFSLVEWDREVERYRLHDLVREYAAGRVTLQDGLRFRLADYLIRRLQEANDEYQEGGDKAIRASHEFDAVWPHVQEIFQWLCALPQNPRATSTIHAIPSAAPQLFDLKRPPHERIRWRRRALAAARRLGDRHGEGKHLANLGLAWLALGRPWRAKVLFERRIDIARETQDRLHEGKGLGNLGNALADLGQMELARDLQRQYLEIAESIEDRRGQGNALSNLASATETLDLNEAIALHENALAISRQIKDRRAEGRFLGKLGRAYAHQGDVSGAIEHFEQALPIHDELGNRADKASDCWELGYALEKQGRLDDAIEAIRECVEIEAELGHFELEDPEAKRHAQFLVVLEKRQREEPSFVPECWVGRQHYLDRLTDALSRLEHHEATTFLVEGASGIGKTALVNQFLYTYCMSEKYVVLRGKYYEQSLTAFKGFDALVDGLTQHLARMPAESVQRLLPSDVGALRSMFPILDKLPAVTAAMQREADSVDGPGRWRRGFNALRELLGRLAETSRVVIFLDDLQWAGRDSAELFANLFCAPDAPVCLTICALRNEKNEFVELLRKKQDQGDVDLPWFKLAPLDRLSEEETVALARGLLGDSAGVELAERIAEQSHGEPLFVEMLTKHALEIGPHSGAAPQLAEVILALVHKLTPAKQEILDLLTVAGLKIEEPFIVQAATLPSAREVVRALEKEKFVKATNADGRRYIDVYHDKYRETIDRALDAQRRIDVCRRLIPVVREASGCSVVLGNLYAGVGDSAEAYACYWEAAGVFYDQMAFAAAAGQYENALEQLQKLGAHRPLQCAVLRKLADALRRSGEVYQAASHYHEAAGSADDDHARLDLLCERARCLLTSGHVPEGEAAIREVLRVHRIRPPCCSWESGASLLGNYLRLKWRGLETGATAPRESPRRQQRLQVLWAAAAGFSVIDPLRAFDFSTRYLLHALRVGDTTSRIRALTTCSGHIAALGNEWQATADHLIDRVADLAQQDGKPYAQAALSIARGVRDHLYSSYATSYDYCKTAVDLLSSEAAWKADPRCGDAIWESNVANSMALWSLMYMGRIDEMHSLQRELIEMAEQRHDLFAGLNHSTQVGTHILLAQDRTDDAARRLARDRERLEKSQAVYSVQHQNLWLAQAFLEQYCGRGDQAWRIMADARSKYRRSNLYRVQHMRIDCFQATGRAALAAAAASRSPKPLLKEAEAAAVKLDKMQTEWAAAHASLIRAALAAIAADSEAAGQSEAAALFEATATAFAGRGHLFAAAAKVRAAQLRASGIEDALQIVKGCGVTNPQAMVAALIPGRYTSAFGSNETPLAEHPFV